MEICHKNMVFTENGRTYCLACGRTYYEKPSSTDLLIAQLKRNPIIPAKRGRRPKIRNAVG